MQGYDLVAYVEENEARKGNPEHAFTYQGVVYYFVSDPRLKIVGLYFQVLTTPPSVGGRVEAEYLALCPKLFPDHLEGF